MRKQRELEIGIWKVENSYLYYNSECLNFRNNKPIITLPWEL